MRKLLEIAPISFIGAVDGTAYSDHILRVRGRPTLTRFCRSSSLFRQRIDGGGSSGLNNVFLEELCFLAILLQSRK